MDPVRQHTVLAVGGDPGTLEGFVVETADDLLGAPPRLAEGAIGVVPASRELADARGAEVIRSLRERAPDVPVIAVAAGDAEPAHAIDAGASDVLPEGAGPELGGRALRYAAAIREMRAPLLMRQVVGQRTGLYNAR